MTKQNNDSTILAHANVTGENIWYNQTNTGIQLHCKFQVDNMKDIPCEINVSFYPDSLMNDGTFYKKVQARDMHPLILEKKELNLPFTSTTCNDLAFVIPYERLLKQEKDSFFSKVTFHKEQNYVVVFQIVYNGIVFPNMAFYMLGISGKKGLFKGTEYSITRAEIAQSMFTSVQKEEPELSESYENSLEGNDNNPRRRKTRVVPKPIKMPINPLSQVLRQLIKDRILDPSHDERIIHIELELNETTNKYNFPWEEFYDPEEENSLSNAIMRLADKRYIRNTLRAKNLMIALREKGL